ncbi:alpha/beta hydrolase [Paenibacillus antarcticus]|uniref:Alpha/beta hydrolase n=1 Tax=Paenibacillus antarcticus TaxID=253703 RepID=A0A168NB08_9BACL|nr:alpha/beta hydrolase [Paenibacillus antarcticus]OAB45599.1 hypothetical protein PBAT_11825 [Paenibacillus antarcticus]
MMNSYILRPSFWGREVKHRYIHNDSASLVVIFPGKNYSCELPLLYYASQSAIEHNHDILLLEYGYQSARVELEFEALSVLVDECTQAIIQIMASYDNLIFVSKSLGTIVAGQVAEAIDNKGIRHVYLTPLDETVPYIQHARGIVVYGTQDRLFSKQSIQAIEGLNNIEVHAIEEGTHALEVGTVRGSLIIMNAIVDIYDSFFQSE